MLRTLRRAVVTNLMNIPGWRTDRKIIVIESDDWGSIRMPSKKAFQRLLAAGIRVDRSIYDTFDTLEQRKDLEYLFETISNYKDVNGNHPVFTFNTVMGNPAFSKIKGSKFEQYFHEDFFESYFTYHQDNLAGLWCKAIDDHLITPQFHAREHLNVSLWMEALRRDHRETKIAFDHGFWGLKTQTPSSSQKNYLAAYWPTGKQDFKNKIAILEDGLGKFKDKFGFLSDSFVACNFIYPGEMEKYLSTAGIKYLQTQRGQISPDISTGAPRTKRHFTGQTNEFNQSYFVRNCFFEPTLTPDIDPVDRCLKEIQVAFRWKKPAIISSHRINYVGGLSTENRDNGLYGLNKLLKRILDKWPDVEFLSTDQLGNTMENSL